MRRPLSILVLAATVGGWCLLASGDVDPAMERATTASPVAGAAAAAGAAGSVPREATELSAPPPSPIERERADAHRGSEGRAAERPAGLVPASVAALLRNHDFELRGVPLGEVQLSDLAIVAKTLGNEVAGLGTRLHELANPVIDGFFATKDSLAVALHMGTVKKVTRVGEPAGSGPRPHLPSHLFFRTSSVEGESQAYAAWLFVDEHPQLRETWQRRDQLRKEIRSTIARIGGASVRPTDPSKAR